MEDNPYTFNSPAELIEQIEALGHADPQDNEIVVDISRTPLESIWPSKDVNYGDPPQSYESVGFGGNVSTPWGELPEVIVLVRKDVANQLKKNPPKPEDIRLPWNPEQAVKIHKPSSLFPPGWKPAPGFTDPRKDFK